MALEWDLQWWVVAAGGSTVVIPGLGVVVEHFYNSAIVRMAPTIEHVPPVSAHRFDLATTSCSYLPHPLITLNNDESTGGIFWLFFFGGGVSI